MTFAELGIKPKITREEYVRIARSVAGRDTASPINQPAWSTDNPLFGHCAIVSAHAQTIFGGHFRRASLENGDSHYWLKNLFDSPEPFDPTAEQFGDKYPTGLETVAIERKRSYVLDPVRFSDSVRRYKLFSWRFIKEYGKNNPLFEDEIYRKCLWQAFDSPCQKMAFGCIAISQGEIVAFETNGTSLDPIKSEQCKDICVRLKITSRTDQDKGACDHAEEWTLRRIKLSGADPSATEFYIAGIYGLGSGCHILKKRQFLLARGVQSK